MRALSKQAPGVTGVFFDSVGDLTISVGRDGFDAPSLAAVVAWVRSYSGQTAPNGPVRLKRVKYDYDSLSAAYATLERNMRVEDGVNLTAIDGKTGTIRVGVFPYSRVPQLRARLNAAGIADDMLVFEQDEVAVSDATLNSDGVRPAVGALEIVSHEDTQCSIGFNVMRWDTGTDPATSPKYFLTAGHCAGSTWGQNRSLPYTQVTGSYEIGSEYDVVPIVNYPAWQCPSAGKSPCELADALVVAYDDTIAVAYGNVAQVDGSRNITGYYNVQGTIIGAYTGEVVTMVGSSTGKSTGQVTLECTDRQVATAEHPSPVWVLCLDQALYAATGGDSGAPVFVPYDPAHPTQTPVMVGIHSNHDSSYRYYSPLNQIDYAFNYAYYHQ